jgi:hypothetical protein
MELRVIERSGAVPIPEPQGLALLIVGVCLLAGDGWQRKQMRATKSHIMHAKSRRSAAEDDANPADFYGGMLPQIMTCSIALSFASQSFPQK